MVCAWLPDSTLSKKILDASWGALKLAALKLLLYPVRQFWPSTGECICPTPVFNDLLFKIAVRSDRLCILLSGLLDDFVTSFNLRRTNHGIGLNLKELMYGRLEMK